MGTGWKQGLARRFGLAVVVAITLLAGVAGGTVAADPPPGPPFPSPTGSQHVYDYAHIWTTTTIERAEQYIAEWAARTGSEAVVYSQIVPEGLGVETARGQAADLGNQWKLGRAGFDDGLVILFDIYPSRLHGQVVLVSGDGFRNTYMSDSDAQHLFDTVMKPSLAGGNPDFNRALLDGMASIDTRISPAGAATLQAARVIDALLGLVVAPLLVLLLLGWPLFHWLRFGRDPQYLDDPSILMPAPPDALTAATGALVFDGQSSRRTLTTAMLDLASRGEIAFAERSQKRAKVAIDVQPPSPADQAAQAELRLANRRPVSDAERYALDELKAHSVGGLVENEELLAFGQKSSEFTKRLEAHAVAQGWFAQAPTSVTQRWLIVGFVELALAIGAAVVGANVPVSGLVVVGVGIAIAGVGTLLLARVMPARTMSGAVIRAMLAAYRRTLAATMAQARSMRTVVEEAKLPWIGTPDQALVWATALGLQSDAERVLERSREDLERGHAAPSAVWFPFWWNAGGAARGFGSGGPAGSGGGSVFSGSAIPNIGGMMAALGTIGNTPASSGGGGVGGGGGGFGGGAGGGF